MKFKPILPRALANRDVDETIKHCQCLRFWPLTRYPHLNFYMEMDDHIDVWRVLHGERDIPAWMHQPDQP